MNRERRLVLCEVALAHLCLTEKMILEVSNMFGFAFAHFEIVEQNMLHYMKFYGVSHTLI